MVSWKRAALSGLTISALIGASTGSVTGHAQSRGADGSPHRSNALCGLDIAWMKMSAEGDHFEIRGGKLALARATSIKDRRLAQRLIADHSASLKSLEALARKLDVKLPDEPSPSQQWELEELGEMGHREFNHDYAELEVKDHQQDIDETEQEVALGCNADVRAEAKADLPVLRSHLKLSKEALAVNRHEH